MIPINIESLDLSDKDKEKLAFFLISWIRYYSKGDNLFKTPKDMIKEILGYSETEFNILYQEADPDLSILEFLTNLKRYGRRGVTSNELIYHFNSIAPRNVIRNLTTLVKSNYVKKITIRLKRDKIIIYEAV